MAEICSSSRSFNQARSQSLVSWAVILCSDHCVPYLESRYQRALIQILVSNRFWSADTPVTEFLATVLISTTFMFQSHDSRDTLVLLLPHQLLIYLEIRKILRVTFYHFSKITFWINNTKRKPSSNSSWLNGTINISLAYMRLQAHFTTRSCSVFLCQWMLKQSGLIRC